MTSIKRLSMALLLGLALTLSATAFAQNATQGNSDKKDSCCAMPSCCCANDSCPMKGGKEGKDCCAKDDKSAGKKDGCCCSGDSCNMKSMKGMKDKQKQG